MNHNTRNIEPLEARTLLASVQGFVFLDADTNGLHSFDDPGFVNSKNKLPALVQLFDAGPNQRLGGGDDKILTSVSANATDGSYRFDNLDAGFYIVRVRNIPKGFRFQARDLDFDDPSVDPQFHLDSDVDGKGRTAAFQLGPNEAGEASAGLVRTKAPGKIVAVVNGLHADGGLQGGGINFGSLSTGQIVTRALRWYNAGGQPITIDSATGAIQTDNGQPDGEPTGVFWEFVTDLTNVTVQPGQFVNVIVRYGTNIPGQIGNPGSFVVGGQPVNGPINITANGVTGIGATIRKPLKAPKRNNATFRFPTLYAADPTLLRSESVTTGDVVVIRQGGSFRAKAALVTQCDTVNGRFNGLTADNCEVMYQITPPGGTWDRADNGTYEVRHIPNAVFDDQNNAVAPRLLGTFRVRYKKPRPAAQARADVQVASAPPAISSIPETTNSLFSTTPLPLSSTATDLW